MTDRVQSWIGWCGALALLVSCSSSGGGGTGGAGLGGSGGLAAGGSGGSAAGGKSGGSGGSAGATGGSGGGQTVGTSGGSVTQAGVTLDIPPNAVTVPTTITVAPTTAPGGYVLASQAYEFGPAGTVFAQPVAVTIQLTSPMPGAHVFWSNATGGFDDVGGTVNGSSITAMVSHFSTGFCALPPSSSGSGGATATGGASGGGGDAGGAGSGTGGQVAGTGGGSSSGAGGSSAGGGGTGAGGAGTGVGGAATGTAGNTGAAGVSGSGVAGSSGTGVAGGSGTGAAGSTGAGGTAGPTDAGLGPDAEASLCKTVPLNLPGATLHYPEAGAAPDASTYTGGTVVSGKMSLISVSHYGGGTYTGVRQEQLTIDTTAQTMVFGEYLPNTPGAQYKVMTYSIVAPNTLQVTVVCNSVASPSGTFDMYYTDTGGQITLTTAGSNDVLLYSLPGA